MIRAMADLFDTIVNLCKRRGFVFPSSEIYGGIGSSYDYGPLGVELKRNVKEQWWRATVALRADVVGIDAAIIMAPQVWEASGHVATFADPLVDCTVCKRRFRADHLEDRDCPNNKKGCEFTEARQFNLMFKTFLGPVEDDSSVVYLRPETAQGIFVNFPAVVTTSRKKVPFGIAQIGKSFRNEITPGKFTYRTREFEQMEMEFFCAPEDAAKWYEYWIEERLNWYLRLGVAREKLRIRPHDSDELSHYSRGTSDIEYEFPWGWGELEGVANRGDFDLTQHAAHSGKDLTYFDQENDRRFVPHVVEPAAGCDRATLTFLMDAYAEEDVRGEKRALLRLDKRLAPYKCAVLPLSKNPDLVPTARKLADEMRAQIMTDYDEAGAIGRRYRRQDEIGTPFCVTVDFDTLEDQGAPSREGNTSPARRGPVAAPGAGRRRRLEEETL